LRCLGLICLAIKFQAEPSLEPEKKNPTHEKKAMAIFEKTKPNEDIQFIIEIDRNTKSRETTGIKIKLKTATLEIDMKEAIVSQESFTKSIPY